MLAAGAAAQGGVVSRDWADGKLDMRLDDGSALIEWMSPGAFRVARSWGAPLKVSTIAHAQIVPQFEDVGDTMTMRSRYLTVVVDRGNMRIHINAGSVNAGQNEVTHLDSARSGDAVSVQFALGASDRVFGLDGEAQDGLSIRGQKLNRDRGVFLSSAGYGMYVAQPCVFDMGAGSFSSAGASSMELIFYWGPTPKEILERHNDFFNRGEVKGTALDLLSPGRLPRQATALPPGPIATWDDLKSLVRRLNEWSLSGVIYPALDLTSFDPAPPEVKQRSIDLSTLLPLIYRTSGEGGLDAATRAQWTPYLLTYLREAYDRGYPLIRPLPMQFWRDANSDQQTDVFMLGDEVLLAPVLDGSTRRRLDLPRGIWTDLRTNQEYRGNQSIEVDAPPGRVPMFVRNGWIVPLQENDRMELHYFPSLGAEFFLWEADVHDNSQFHAAPADDFVRVEVETKRRRTYEWILHHTTAPREVAEESGAYARVNARANLRPGAWWHDDANNDLHLMLRAEPETDRIVNISF